jgi:hypothetical protein
MRDKGVREEGGGGPFGFAVYFVFGEGDVFDILCGGNFVSPFSYILIASPLQLISKTGR